MVVTMPESLMLSTTIRILYHTILLAVVYHAILGIIGIISGRDINTNGVVTKIHSRLQTLTSKIAQEL